MRRRLGASAHMWFYQPASVRWTIGLLLSCSPHPQAPLLISLLWMLGVGARGLGRGEGIWCLGGSALARHVSLCLRELFHFK